MKLDKKIKKKKKIKLFDSEIANQDIKKKLKLIESTRVTRLGYPNRKQIKKKCKTYFSINTMLKYQIKKSFKKMIKI
jgi:ribosomal protein S13